MEPAIIFFRIPIRFGSDLRVTMQALGWRTENRKSRRYLPLQDDIASVAFWYQTLPTAPFPELPDQEYLEVIRRQPFSESDLSSRLIRKIAEQGN